VRPSAEQAVTVKVPLLPLQGSGPTQVNQPNVTNSPVLLKFG
jgi:hypothetical protein